MIRSAAAKHPDSDKWYWFEWSEKELQGANLSAVTWTLPSGITKTDEAFTGRAMGIKLDGGTLGADYDLAVQVQTTTPETLNEEVRIRVRKTGH